MEVEREGRRKRGREKNIHQRQSQGVKEQLSFRLKKLLITTGVQSSTQQICK